MRDEGNFYGGPETALGDEREQEKEWMGGESGMKCLLVTENEIGSSNAGWEVSS